MQRIEETSNRRAARLDVRLAQRTKEKIEEAALVSHQTLTDFVVTNLLRASEEALKHHQAIRLTSRDRDLFMAALDAAERPNPVLRKAAQRFKRKYRYNVANQRLIVERLADHHDRSKFDCGVEELNIAS